MQHAQFFCLALALACTAIVSDIALCAESAEARTAKKSKPANKLSSPDNYWEKCVRRGYHCIWSQEQMPIKVLIQSGNKEPYWKEKHDQLLRKAFIEMTSASGGKIKFKFVTQKPCDIQCIYRPANKKEFQANVLAFARVPRTKHHITSAKITFYTNKSYFTINERFYMTALHEIGHAMGLNHSDSNLDIMYTCAATNCYRTTYSARDLKTIEMLYNFKPPEKELVELEQRRIMKMSHYNQRPNLKVLNQDQRDSYTNRVMAQFKKRLNETLLFRNGIKDNCTIKFLVDRNGYLYDHHVAIKSSNRDFNQNVLTALVLSEPLPKIAGLKMTEVVDMHLLVNSAGDIVDLKEKHKEPLKLLACQPVVDESSRKAAAKLERLKRLSAIATGEAPWDQKQAFEYWKRSIAIIAMENGDKLNLPEGSKIELKLYVQPDGNVDNVDIVWSSGCLNADRRAIELLRSRAPYPRPPSQNIGISTVFVTFKNNGK